MSAADPPVVPGRIHGLREWKVDDAEPPRLCAIWQRQPWPPGQTPFEARCADHSHDAPQPDCSCGIYALHPRPDNADDVFPSRDWRGSVTGIIEAWGEVEVHHDGFRAQYARPRCLVLPAGADHETQERVAGVAAAYGAEVITCADAGDLESHCLRLGLGLDPGAVSDLLPAEPSLLSAEPPGTYPAYSPPGRQGGVVRRAVDAGKAVAAVVQMVLGLGLVYGFIFMLILGGIIDLLGLAPAVKGRPAATDRALRIVDQAVFPTSYGPLYVAVVHNSSRSATAFDVVPVGELRARDGSVLAKPDSAENVDVAPSIPPRRSAVVFDWLDGKEPHLPIRRFTLRMHATAGFRRAPSPHLEIRSTRADLRNCLVGATVLSGRRREAVDVAVVARDGRGRLIWADSNGVAGPLRRGAQRQTLLRIYPADCRRSVRSVAAYPWWSADELARRGR